MISIRTMLIIAFVALILDVLLLQVIPEFICYLLLLP